MLVSSIGVKADDLMGFIGLIKDGLPIDALYHLKVKLDIPESRLMNTVAMSKRTLTRRKQEGRLSTVESEKIVRIGKLFDKAVQVFGGSDAAAAKWFKASARGLGGKTPLSMVETEIGAQEVLALLTRIEHGVFPG